MANKKPFRRAQERVPGASTTRVRTGYVSLQQASNNLKKTQIRKCEPYKTLILVAQKLSISPKRLFFKIIRTDTSGGAHVSVIESASSASGSKKEWFIFLNILQERVLKVTPISSQKKRKRVARRPDAKSVPKRSRGRSYKSRKTNRRTRRSRLRRRTQPNVRLKNQIKIKPNEAATLPQPLNFNTPAENIPKKDFASVFETANNKLYSDESDQVIEIETPPGVAKYMELGIDVDRPGVLASTELNRIIYDDSLTVYDQMVLERGLRLQAIFENLAPLDDLDLTKMLETQAQFEATTDAAITSLEKIASVDEEIMNDISVGIFDIASSLGFKSTELLSRIYIQTAHDLGAVSEVGPFDFKFGERQLNSLKNDINIDLKRTGASFASNFIKSGLNRKDITKISNYNSGGKTGNLLGFHSTINPPELSGVNWANGVGGNLGRPYSNEDVPILMQLIYTELMLSKLYTAGDVNVVALKEKGTINIAEAFLGDLSSAAIDLNSVDVPTGLASIAKFNSGGVNYWPMESVIQNSSGINGRTFLDAVVQPAVGALIEDADPDFALLNAWIENSRSTLSTFFKYTDAMYDKGGATIVFNECLLAIVDFLSDRNKKIGSKKHPFSNSMARYDNTLDFDQLRRLLQIALKEMGKTGRAATLYNTFGYKTHISFRNVANEALQVLSRGNRSISSSTKNKLRQGRDFDIAENDQAIRAMNNLLEESSRFFNLFENGIMTSIELLLSDSGILATTTTPDYSTAAEGFFIDQTIQGKELPKDSSESSPLSTHEFTAFSGIPKMMIRRALANIAWSICCQMFGKRNNQPVLDALMDDDYREFIKLSKLAVENLDKTTGPVRWMVTRGVWPPESGDFEDLQADFFEDFVPEEVQEALNDPTKQFISELDDEGVVATTNVLEGWEFLESVEDFCPITFMLDDEDNSTDPFTFVKANRNIADVVSESIVTLRSRCFRMRHLLDAPIASFETFPTKVEEVASKLSFDSIKELAVLPSIDGQEMVTFISRMQIAAAKKSIKLETPSPSLRYLPNKYAVSKIEYEIARSNIVSFIEENYERPDKTIIQTVGIPAGYLSAESMADDEFSLTRNASYMFFPTVSFEPKENRFHPRVFLIPGSFSQCDPEASFENNILNTRFFVAAEGLYDFMDYSSALDFIDSSNAEIILRNHVLDYSIFLTLKILTGIEFNEDTFRYNKLANERYISSDGAKEIPNVMTKFPEAFEDIIKENKVDDFRDAVKLFEDLTIPEINLFMGSLDCRLISPEMVAKQALSPRLYDRVFNILAHPNEHYSKADRAPSGLKKESFSINGESVTGFRISLKDGSTNQIRNDHFAEYNYMVEK